ncbi:MAG TPA: L,D-transpeptidase family protein [Acidimicrobiales bacterium]|nr:L,D-transpeptidase family protein [Acidimicrobiales bacterium]
MLVGLAVVLVAGVVGGLALTSGHSTPPGKKAGGTTPPPSHHVTPFTMVSSSPAAGATNVASNADISLTFSTPVTLGSVVPTLAPAVAGTWEQPSPTTLQYALAAPLIPSQTEVVTIPGGSTGVKGKNGSRLASPGTLQFTVATGDTLRLQQLLAGLDYLPLSFSASGAAAAPKDAAIAQPGTFAWRWSTLPAELTSLWTQGSEDEITKAAVMAFEHNNALTVDGLAGPAVWTALLSAVTQQKTNPNPWVYVLVSKTLPQTLTLYNNGAPQYTNILVNTGAPGADTEDGTFAVFEHVQSSEMKGTNPDGSKYDDPNVPWASYFNGGDALHGFPRAHYGYPQSNGCVEMAIANAATLWPLTPIGTLVTVMGPSSGAGPTTTTTTAPPATTVPPPPATTTPPPPTTTVPPAL